MPTKSKKTSRSAKVLLRNKGVLKLSKIKLRDFAKTTLPKKKKTKPESMLKYASRRMKQMRSSY